jgi:putative colanic acid biosynthesis acetyltransferase WcaB
MKIYTKIQIIPDLIAMNYAVFVLQDWKANSGNTKGRMILLLFRMANFCTTRKIWYWLGLPYLVFYKIFVEWILCIEIPWQVKIGRHCRLYHGQGLVINSDTVIGEHCVLRHNTTIGNREMKNGLQSVSPVVGDYVDIGCNVCIIGPLQVGNHVKIGAGTVLTKDTGSNCTVIGNPAREISNASMQGYYKSIKPLV